MAHARVPQHVVEHATVEALTRARRGWQAQDPWNSCDGRPPTRDDDDSNDDSFDAAGIAHPELTAEVNACAAVRLVANLPERNSNGGNPNVAQ